MNARHVFLVSMVMGSGGTIAVGQSEMIGPIQLPGGSAEETVGPFDNDIPNDPDFKDFTFVGVATNPHGGQQRELTIIFCYIDAVTGAVVPVNPAALPIPIPPGAINHPVSASASLSFCPEEVCINFSQSLGSIEDIGGTFTHECVPNGGFNVPTVSEWSLIIMTVLAFTAGTILFGRRRRAAGA